MKLERARELGFLQLFPERHKLLFFLLKLSQSCIDSGDITKLISAVAELLFGWMVIRHDVVPWTDAAMYL